MLWGRADVFPCGGSGSEKGAGWSAGADGLRSERSVWRKGGRAGGRQTMLRGAERTGGTGLKTAGNRKQKGGSLTAASSCGIVIPKLLTQT